jgi:hypothetical protein
MHVIDYPKYRIQICTDFLSHWATLVELPEKMALCKDAISSIFQSMPMAKFGTEPALIALMMDLLVAYIKVHVFVCSLDYKDFIVMFGAAHETNMKLIPTNYEKLVEWINNVTKLDNNPLRYLHDELSNDLTGPLISIFKSIKPIISLFPSGAEPDRMRVSIFFVYSHTYVYF